MSIQLPTIDFTGLSVGATGKVQIPQPKVQVGELGHLRLYNESGAGLDIVFSNGHGETVPAGAWPMFEIEPETQTFTWIITYVLPNAPVATMKMVYYFPYEGVPPTPALGNSPIGITGGVSTSSVQTLSNETNPANQLVLDVGDTGNVNLYTLYTDGHALWKVDASGVLHQVLKVNTAANFLQLGQAGDITEVLGALTVDQTTILTGVLTAAAANILGTLGNLTHILGNLTVDGTQIFTGDATFNGAGSSISTAHDAAVSGSVKTNSIRDNTNGNLAIDLSAATGAVTLPQLLTATGQITGGALLNLILNAVTGKQIEFDINNVQVGHIDGGGLAFTSKKLFDGSANNLLDWSAISGTFLKGNPAAPNKFQYQADGANTDFAITALTIVSFNTVNGTTAALAHNMKVQGVSTAPTAIVAIGFTSAVSGTNATIGISEVGATTFKASSIAAFPAIAICAKF